MLGSLASGRATREAMKAFAFTDFTPDISSIKIPVLIIHGSADKTVPIDTTSKKAAALIPDNQFVIYEGAPHGLFYTHRERLNNDLIEFITEGSVRTVWNDAVLLPSNDALVTR